MIIMNINLLLPITKLPLNDGNSISSSSGKQSQSKSLWAWVSCNREGVTSCMPTWYVMFFVYMQSVSQSTIIFACFCYFDDWNKIRETNYY